MTAEYPEILLDLAASVAKSLEKSGISADRAADIAFEAAEDLRRRWAGMAPYIPGAAHLDLAPKYQEIYERAYAGEPKEVLARDFGYSVQWIRVLVKSARLARRQKVDAPPLLVDAI